MRGHVSVAIRKVYEATLTKGMPNEDLIKDCFSQVRYGSVELCISSRAAEAPFYCFPHCSRPLFFNFLHCSFPPARPATDRSFTEDPVANIPAANTMIAVMLAVLDIGNQILEQESVFAGLMAMANSDNLEAQVQIRGPWENRARAPGAPLTLF